MLFSLVIRKGLPDTLRSVLTYAATQPAQILVRTRCTLLPDSRVL